MFILFTASLHLLSRVTRLSPGCIMCWQRPGLIGCQSQPLPPSSSKCHKTLYFSEKCGICLVQRICLTLPITVTLCIIIREFAYTTLHLHVLCIFCMPLVIILPHLRGTENNEMLRLLLCQVCCALRREIASLYRKVD